MVITKQYLNNLIQEEVQIVLTEKDVKLFLENEVIPYVNSQKSLLNEQQKQVLEEGIAELLSSVKGAVSKGWAGIKALFSSFFRIVKALPIATSVASALGYVLVHTDEGRQLTTATMDAVTKVMESSAESTQYAQKVLNVGSDLLYYFGMNVGKFDPQVVIDQTSQQIQNVNTAVDMFMAVPTEFFVFAGIAPLGVIIIWKLLKAAWNKATGGSKDKELPPSKSSADIRKSAEQRLADLKKSRYADDPELAAAMAGI